jgi:hypothetical protein
VLRRLRAWLSQPVRWPPYHDTTDWQRLGSSFGRLVGGAHDYGRRDTPAAERWEKGGETGLETRTIRRWALILLLMAYAALVISVLVLAVWWASSLPPPTGTHQ